MEPGNLAVLLVFHQDRVNRLLEQTQRRTYGSASRAPRRGGDGKIFLAGRVSPSGDLRTQLLRLDVRFELLNHQPTSSEPFLLYGISTLYAQSNHIHLAGGRPVISLSFPALPNSLDLPARHFVFLYIFGWGYA